MQGWERTLIWKNGILLTPGTVRPGDRVYQGMRVWDPEKSKFAALCVLEREPPVLRTRILYLGAAAGTTVSFLADYAEVVYAVEFAPRPVRSLIRLAYERNNVIPLFEDARYPERYLPFVERVDILIQDIAQRDQVEIVLRNLVFLKNGGHLILFLKLLSMGSERKEEDMIADAIAALENAGVTRVQMIDLNVYHTGHVALWGVYAEEKETENSPKQIRTAVARSRALHD